MNSHWLSASRLADKLAAGEVPNREIAYLMIANFLLATVIYYGAFTTATAPWTALSLWEAALEAVVVVYGMVQCYEAAGGDSNDRFAAEFNALSFPIWLWITVTVWPLYWLGVWLLRAGLHQVTSDTNETIWRLGHLAGRFEWLWTAAAVVGAQIWYFLWLHRSLRRAWDGRNAR